MEKDINKKTLHNKEIFMNLMTDFAFKHLFGSVKRKHILIQFLNILFEKEGFQVYDVTYHDKEVLGEFPHAEYAKKGFS